ncbi:hypothetical protein [Azohydromonas lata]|uniref:hypothetical protein n=1 Tax=Azohydromonas lata TaxID=45677 RepID=UPI000834E4A4|nr:hypothetical protein [Azohydromonas lata]
MAKEFHDSVAQPVTVTGTGNAALATTTSYPARRTLQSVVSAGAVVQYRIAAVDANGIETGEWETGEGTYLGSDVFQRTTPDAGSSTVPVNFSAGTTKKFTLSINADVLRFIAAMTGGASLTYDSDGDVATATINGTVFTIGYTTVAGKKTWTSVAGGGSTITLNYDSNGRFASYS